MNQHKAFLAALPCLMLATAAQAHDPVFGIGPHVLYKDGIEVHVGAHREQSDEPNTEMELELKYGITGDWVAGIGTGYNRSETFDGTDSGQGPSSLFTKYRFWRNDMPGAQESAAIMGKVILDDGDNGHGVAERDGSDYLLGLTYGFEGRKWYRWASVRHRFNSDAANGAERPDKTLADLVIGVRPVPTEYLEPDWVWMLELNYEHTEPVSAGFGGSLRRIGGDQWFVSPGVMWTLRNVGVKAGVQFSVADSLASGQEADDYRALLEVEWHL
jgi:hypothetical protein